MNVDHDVLSRLGLVIFGGALFLRFLLIDLRTFGPPWDRRRNGRRLANTTATILPLLIAVIGANATWYVLHGKRLIDANLLLYLVSVTMLALLLVGWWEMRHRNDYRGGNHDEG